MPQHVVWLESREQDVVLVTELAQLGHLGLLPLIKMFGRRKRALSGRVILALAKYLIWGHI